MISTVTRVRRKHKHQIASFVYAFSPASQLPPAFNLAFIVLDRFVALLRPSTPLPDPAPRFTSLGSDIPHHATFSLGIQVLWLWLLVTRLRHPSRVFRPISTITWWVPRLSLCRPLFILVPIPVPSRSVTFPPCSLWVSGSPFSTTWLDRHRVLRPEPLATCKRHLQFAEMVPRLE